MAHFLRSLSKNTVSLDVLLSQDLVLCLEAFFFFHLFFFVPLDVCTLIKGLNGLGGVSKAV